MTSPTFEPEEDWEGEIGSLLSGLPMVDPPDGFIETALDHRPLYGGRVLASLMMSVFVAVAVALGVGLAADGSVIPEFDRLTERHLAAQATLASDGDAASAASTAELEAERLSVIGSDPVLFTPQGYEPAGTFKAEDLRQAVYEREGTAVSVFIQPGRLDWDALPDSGRRVTISGQEAWVDDAKQITILSAKGETITILGLTVNEVSASVDGVPTGDASIYRRSLDLAATAAQQLGFPKPSG